MPELPEVEATRLSFAERIAGARVHGVRLGKPLRWPLGVDPQQLSGRVVQQVRRRGKYLLLDVDSGLLLLHLGMSGSLRFAANLPPPGNHDHFDLLTDQGTLRLHDPRRFGSVVWAAAEDDPVAQKLLGKLGVEPLEATFEVQHFWQALQQRRAAIKSVLLAGEVVVGVGNIYASEVLFAARVHPERSAASLTHLEVEQLHLAIRTVLTKALRSGGSTLRDFSNAAGEKGHFQLQTQVYDRAGEPCRVCYTPIEVFKQGQRSSYFCPECQPR